MYNFRKDSSSISADNAPDPKLIIEVDDNLVADVEGMSIYHGTETSYLVVSSQGDDSYVLYSSEAPYEYVGRFNIAMNAAAGIDGASETDGLDVTSAALGSNYPDGLLVVQDGRNVMPTENQNYKLVSWSDIARELNLWAPQIGVNRKKKARLPTWLITLVDNPS